MVFDFAGYIEGTRETAVYPEFNTGSRLELSYLALGLGDEWQEAVDAYLQNDHAARVSETGDVAWYLFRLFDALAISCELDVTSPPTLTKCHRRSIAQSIGKVQGLVKRVIREKADLHADTPERKKVTELLHGLVQMWVANCRYYEVDFVLALEKNQEKLLDRKKRNTLTGSGGSR